MLGGMPVPAHARVPLRSLATFVGLAGVTVALVWLFESMRAVMAIGGSCANGGPYVVAVPCPHGTALTTTGAVIGGAVMAAVYTIFGLRVGPRITLLVWSALFLSLGWNFLDFGLRAPSGSTDRIGWLVCAAVFAVLGGGPMLGRVFPRFARDLLWSDGVGLPVGLRSGRRAATQPAVPPPPGAHDSAGSQLLQRPPPPPPPPADDLPTALTKLAELHDRGALSDAEYAEVKRRLLEDQ